MNSRSFYTERTSTVSFGGDMRLMYRVFGFDRTLLLKKNIILTFLYVKEILDTTTTGIRSRCLRKKCGYFLKCSVYAVQAFFNFNQMDESTNELKQSMFFLGNDAGLCQVKRLIDQSCQDLEEKHRLLHQCAFVLQQLDRRGAAL